MTTEPLETKSRILCFNTNISQTKRELWKNSRKYIGGSDASVVCGVHSFKSVLSLVEKIKSKKSGQWEEEKKEYTDEEIESYYSTFPPTITLRYRSWIGHEREPDGRLLYELITGNKVTEGYLWIPFAGEWEDFTHVSPDGIIKEKDVEFANYMAVLEIKSHISKLPDLVPMEHVIQVYHTMLLLECKYVDYFGVAYDCSTKENFVNCKILDIRYIRFSRSRDMIDWYFRVLKEFKLQLEKGFDFATNDAWKEHLMKTCFVMPYRSAINHSVNMKKREYKEKIEIVKNRTISQAAECLSLWNVNFDMDIEFK
jgi:hypothetical protein